MEPDSGHPYDPHTKTSVYSKPCICTTDADDIYRNRSADDHSIYYIWQNVGFVALPTAYFAYLIPCILLYMVLATSLKKAYVRHYGELL